MIYATKEQLLLYLGLTEADLPSDIDRILARASETIDYFTSNHITNLHYQIAESATCAQVEYWLQIDESMDIIGSVKSFSMGKFSMDYATSMPVLAPRARQLLLRSGLMYRGVRII
ncbi:MAG: hypothetical protein CVU90_02005 [Firmicutes bacterium HGW-Firmicutes-15]|nr:MAG: hypothetical protein CVU90_02005 [Firmicutes bacterium HGW-Firmicutes-15]